MKNDNCIFCKLAAGEIPSKTLYEDEIDVILGLKTEEEVNLNKKSMFETEAEEEVEENEADFSEETVADDININRDEEIEDKDVIIDVPDFLKGRKRK